MACVQEALTKRTNCGKPTYRFSYDKDKVIVQTPCFEPTCNTCAWRQPAIAKFEDPSSFAVSQALARRKQEQLGEVEQKLGQLGRLHVRNAAPVKLRSGRRAVQSGRVEKEQKNSVSSRCRPLFRKRIVLKFSGRLREYRTLVDGQEKRRQQRQQHQRLVLTFKTQGREAGAAGSAERAQKQPRLFLIIGKTNTLKCRWENALAG